MRPPWERLHFTPGEGERLGWAQGRGSWGKGSREPHALPSSPCGVPVWSQAQGVTSQGGSLPLGTGAFMGAPGGRIGGLPGLVWLIASWLVDWLMVDWLVVEWLTVDWLAG